ncbi:unnamed protein product [Paramecium sonneborni]|uniref:Uncharacterized protein n=1 Tax=Paramecium sonneborni TaxID=65129 RepID=A0A8S1Q2V8_9CILI|nr:unnamed protein product [Paramecium sonneborni]
MFYQFRQKISYYNNFFEQNGVNFWIIEFQSKHTQKNQDILGRNNKIVIGSTESTNTKFKLIDCYLFSFETICLQKKKFDVDIPFEDLKTIQTMAIFKIKLAFGTNNQINKINKQVNSEIIY